MNLPAPHAAATSMPINAAVALMAGTYLIAVWYRGNLGALANQASVDFFGDSSNTPFWRWGAAVLILLAITRSDTGQKYFGGLFAVAIAAMFINTVSNHPAQFAALNAGIRQFFGYKG
jgi:hypothetical protein